MTERDALRAEGLSVGYGLGHVIEDLTLGWRAGRLHALIGANGSGKSTLLRALARLLPTAAGSVLLEGTALTAMRSREIARRLAVLPQRTNAPDAMTVGELVAFGRHPHRSALAGESEADRTAVRDALAFVGASQWIDRPLGTLSGGQRQLAWIAMALAQKARTLLLDEPTAALDLRHQLEVLDLLDALRRGGEHTAIVVLHDVNLAARYADDIVALAGGEVVARGGPREILTPDVLRRVYGVDAEIVEDPRSGLPQCIAYPACTDADRPPG